MEQPAARRHVVIRRRAAVALAVVALAAMASCLASGSTRRPGPPPRVFAFLSRAGGAELDHLRRYGSRISVLAPNWYALGIGSLTVTGAASPPVVTLAAAQHVPLWPVVNADLTGSRVVASAQDRVRIADAVAAVAGRQGYAGITLDLEQLPAGQTAAFDRLVSLIAARLHATGRRLAVYVPRRTAAGGAVTYDWRSLARTADLLIASGYDEHWATSRPGPVTTAAGFSAMLDYAETVSLRRIAPAIGAIGYSWPLSGGPGRLISSVAADQLRLQAGARLRGAGGDAYFVADGQVVHFQTTAGLAARAYDARLAGMRWLALFSLGREPDALWSHITTARQPAPASAHH